MWRSLVIAAALLAPLALLTPPSAAQLRSAPPADPVTTLLQSGRTANANGRFDEAERAFREALEREVRTGAPEVQGAILLDLALNVSNQGRSDEAAALFRRAEPLLQASADLTLRARLATYLAIDATNRRDFAAARRFASNASEQWSELAVARAAVADDSDGQVAAYRAEQAHALALQGRIELRLDDPLAAYAAASHAVLILQGARDVPQWWLADALLVLGEVSARTDRASAAETYLKRAVAIRRQVFGGGPPTIQALAALGGAYQQAGMSEQAITTYREAFGLARALPSSAGVLDAEALVPFAAAIADRAKAASPTARAALFGESFQAFQLAGSPVIDKTIGQAATRLSIADPSLARAVRALQEEQRRLEQARLRYVHVQSLPDDERDGATETALREEMRSAGEAVGHARAGLNAQFPDYERLSAVGPVSIEALRGTLARDEGVLSFLFGRERSFVQLVTGDGSRMIEIAAGKEGIAEQVATLRRAFSPEAPAPFDLARANALHHLLLGGLTGDLAKVRQLTIVSNGALANLPFALLVGSPARTGDYAQADWLIRHHALAYTPSLQALVRVRTTPRASRPTQPLIGFGDPQLQGTPRGGGLAALAGACGSGGAVPRQMLTALAPLPDTAGELDSVALAVGAPRDRLFLGARATEAAVRAQELANYRIVYFATHGLLPGELRCQTEPGLVLTPPSTTTERAADGLLDASEIAALPLNADLVVLSACNTAGGGGEALSGLAEAFLFAGARNLLATHWQIASAETARLMTDVFRSRAWAGQDMPAALQQAQLAELARPDTAHPFYWAAFVMIGDGFAPVPAAPALAAR